MLRRRDLVAFFPLTFTFRFQVLSVGAAVQSLFFSFLFFLGCVFSNDPAPLSSHPASLALPSRVVRVELRGEDKD